MAGPDLLGARHRNTHTQARTHTQPHVPKANQIEDGTSNLCSARMLSKRTGNLTLKSGTAYEKQMRYQ